METITATLSIITPGHKLTIENMKTPPWWSRAVSQWAPQNSYKSANEAEVWAPETGVRYQVVEPGLLPEILRLGPHGSIDGEYQNKLLESFSRCCNVCAVGPTLSVLTYEPPERYIIRDADHRLLQTGTPLANDGSFPFTVILTLRVKENSWIIDLTEHTLTPLQVTGETKQSLEGQ